MKKKFILFVLSLFIVFFGIKAGYTYNNKFTHPAITEEAIKKTTNLGVALTNQFGITGSSNELLKYQLKYQSSPSWGEDDIRIIGDTILIFLLFSSSPLLRR